MRLMICDEELSLFDLNSNVTVAVLEALWSISTLYSRVHCWVGLFICVFGSLANCVHIFVLSRPAMQKCAVNRLLSIIALCDIATMTSYTVFVVRFEFAVDKEEPPMGYDFVWIIFLLAHVVCSIALHTITLYLTVVTALIRYKTLKRVGSLWNHENIAFPIFLAVALLTIVLCIPTFLIHSIIPVHAMDPGTGQNLTLYTVGLAEFEQLDTCLFFKLNLWLTGIIFKVIPCVLLLLFTLALLWELEKNRRKRRLICSGATLAYRRHSAQSDRTTKILLILLMVFFCTEFPQGILAIMNGLFPNDIHQFVYLSLGELLDLLSLINCNTCFVVYPLISSQYRATLRALADCIRQLAAGNGWQAATANLRQSVCSPPAALFGPNGDKFHFASLLLNLGTLLCYALLYILLKYGKKSSAQESTQKVFRSIVAISLVSLGGWFLNDLFKLFGPLLFTIESTNAMVFTKSGQIFFNLTQASNVLVLFFLQALSLTVSSIENVE